MWIHTFIKHSLTAGLLKSNIYQVITNTFLVSVPNLYRLGHMFWITLPILCFKWHDKPKERWWKGEMSVEGICCQLIHVLLLHKCGFRRHVWKKIFSKFLMRSTINFKANWTEHFTFIHIVCMLIFHVRGFHWWNGHFAQQCHKVNINMINCKYVWKIYKIPTNKIKKISEYFWILFCVICPCQPWKSNYA